MKSHWAALAWVELGEKRKKILRTLFSTKTPISAKILKEKTGFELSHISRITTELVDKNLICCQSDKKLKMPYGKIYEITPEGKRVMHELIHKELIKDIRQHFLKLGYHILESTGINAEFEPDLIFHKGKELTLIEVKTFSTFRKESIEYMKHMKESYDAKQVIIVAPVIVTKQTKNLVAENGLELWDLWYLKELYNQDKKNWTSLET